VNAVPAPASRPSSRLALAVALLACVLAASGFAALGTWQVKRLAWKEALIARVEGQLQAVPTPAPGPAQWGGLERSRDEYRCVRLHGRFDLEHETAVRALTELGSGYWILTPLQDERGFQVLVNRGFVPPDWLPHLRQASPQPPGGQAVEGLLRLSEPGGAFLQANDPAADRWTSRDVAGMAAARGLSGAPVAPYFVDAQASASTWPRAGLTVVHFSNNHLVYACTWFALALMSTAAAAYLVIDWRRQRRLAGDPRRERLHP
jgi:surfeit locus 1 family protein